LYRLQLVIEQANFHDVSDVHDLPPIFHYWSNKYLLSTLSALGYRGTDDFFVQHLLAVLRLQRSGSACRFVSIGSGNCDFEIRLALALKAAGFHNFVIECIDVNAAMLARGVALAGQVSVSEHIIPVQADFNTWRPNTQYHAAIANQSLHHVLALEALFDSIRDSLLPEGVFIVSDMIGRNGHLRWPEARTMVDAFWQTLPREKRYNHAFKRTDLEFREYDASVSGFEGIRAQDILPLLVERFHFETFIGYGNVVMPFIDRAYGPNFDIHNPADLAFIDQVHAADEAALMAGQITPTQMLAAMRVQAVDAKCAGNLVPSLCIRRPSLKNVSNV
jgi:SAM-dependent methyltransferase